MEIEIVSCVIAKNELAKAMQKAGLSQEATARRTGMSSRQLNRILKGSHCPSLERAMALSVVLGVPLLKLFTIKVETRKAVR